MRVCPTCYAQEQENARYCGLCGTPLLEIKSSVDQMVGQIIGGKFSIERLIGRGGMGDVYLACDRVLDRKVAIKILNHRFRGDETVIMRFHKEAKSYARVNHANAVVLFDYGQLDDGNVYLVMEYVDGCNLSEFLKRNNGPLPQDLTLQLSVQLSEALSAAHFQGVVHRDLKPDNIMLVEGAKGRLQVKVLDFGIAKLLDDQSNDQLTQAGMVFGTPEFMSPEQAQGIEVDHRTDIYAFGMIVYFMMTHHLPFEGKNKIAILNQQVNDPPTPPSQRVPGVEVHPEFERLVMNCIEKARDDRYPSFDAILSDLGRLFRGEPLTLGAEFRQAPQDGEPHLDFVDIEEPHPAPAPRPAPSLPRSGPRAEMSGLIAVGHIPRSEVSGVLSIGNISRSEVSGVMSIGNVGAVSSKSGPSGPRQLGTPTPPSTSDINWRLDTQSPSWFGRYDNEEPGLDSSSPALPAATPNPSKRVTLSATESVPSGDMGALDSMSLRMTDPSLQGPTQRTPTEAPFTMGNGSDEDDGFAIPDDIGGPHTGPYKPHRDSGGFTGLIVFLVLVIGGAAAAYWLWWLPSQEAKNAGQPATSASATPSSDASAIAPLNPDNTPDASPDPPDAPIAKAPDASAPPAPTKPPPPLPDAFTDTLRQRTVARAILNRAQALFDETKFKEADQFLAFEHLSLPSITGPLQDDITTKRATTKRAQELVGSATADLQSLRCDRAETSITELASISPPAAAQLQPKIKTCKRKLEAPPNKIPD